MLHLYTGNIATFHDSKKFRITSFLHNILTICTVLLFLSNESQKFISINFIQSKLLFISLWMVCLSFNMICFIIFKILFFEQNLFNLLCMVLSRHAKNYDILGIPDWNSPMTSWGFPMMSHVMGIPRGCSPVCRRYTCRIFGRIFAFILQVNTTETKLFEFLCFSSSF